MAAAISYDTVSRKISCNILRFSILYYGFSLFCTAVDDLIVLLLLHSKVFITPLSHLNDTGITSLIWGKPFLMQHLLWVNVLNFKTYLGAVHNPCWQLRGGGLVNDCQWEEGKIEKSTLKNYIYFHFSKATQATIRKNNHNEIFFSHNATNPGTVLSRSSDITLSINLLIKLQSRLANRQSRGRRFFLSIAKVLHN